MFDLKRNDSKRSVLNTGFMANICLSLLRKLRNGKTDTCIEKIKKQIDLYTVKKSHYVATIQLSAGCAKSHCNPNLRIKNKHQIGAEK